ncbi:MAG: hypothetical protein F6K45_21010 [Kamptonema sp. SIO1D9]|nr:hypothetical protein [Kamptonema sp. SIO1D9]
MNVKALEVKFAKRFYLWSVEEAKKEAQANFSLISKVKNYDVTRTLLAIRSFPETEQQKILPILIKDYHKQKLEQLGEVITTEEQIILKKIKRLENSPEIKQIAKSQESSFIAISEKKLKINAAKAIYEQLGISSDYYDGFISFDIPIGNNWNIKTSVRYCPYAYEYYQQVWYIDNQRKIQARISAPLINVPRWFGMGFRESWLFLSEEEAVECAETIAYLCKYFLEAVPSLIEGLSL